MKNRDKARLKVKRSRRIEGNICQSISDSSKQIIEGVAIETKKETKFLGNGEGDMPVRCINELAHHGIGAKHIVFIATGRTKPASAMKR